jgi:hypothetical protein
MRGDLTGSSLHEAVARRAVDVVSLPTSSQNLARHWKGKLRRVLATCVLASEEQRVIARLAARNGVRW